VLLGSMKASLTGKQSTGRGLCSHSSPGISEPGKAGGCQWWEGAGPSPAAHFRASLPPRLQKPLLAPKLRDGLPGPCRRGSLGGLGQGYVEVATVHTRLRVPWGCAGSCWCCFGARVHQQMWLYRPPFLAGALQARSARGTPVCWQRGK